MQSSTFKFAQIGLVVAGICLIVGWEFLATFQNRPIEQVGGKLYHTTFQHGGREHKGYSVEFDGPVDRAAIQLAAKRLKSLRNLSLTFSSISDEALEPLAGADNVRQLNLGETKITDQGTATIATMENLVHLNLVRCSITDVGLKQLQPLGHLQKLSLTHTAVTDQGLMALDDFAALQSVSVGWGLVTPEGVEAAQAAMPHIELARYGPPFEDELADIRVTAKNGQPLPDDGGPLVAICREYFNAWQAADAYTLKTLFSRESGARFGDIGPEWQNIRPLVVQQFSGFYNDQAATVKVGGPSKEFSWVRYIVQFTKEEGEWRIENSQMDLN